MITLERLQELDIWLQIDKCITSETAEDLKEILEYYKMMVYTKPFIIWEPGVNVTLTNQTITKSLNNQNGL